MIISIIVAVDEKGGIGKKNRLPWYVHSDLRRFKAITTGHHLVMGRKTYETIGRPLPGRVMIILSHKKDYQPEGCIVVDSLESAIQLAKQNRETELFIIGGGEVFAQALPVTNKIYMTTVHTDGKADIFFPEINLTDWKVLHEEHVPLDSKDQYASDFTILIRRVVNRVDKTQKPLIIRQTS